MRCLLRRVLAVCAGVAAALGVVCGVKADVPPIPNGDFASGAEGTLPDKWFVPVAGLRARVATDAANGDARAVELKMAARRAGTVEAAPFGNFMQSVDATPYRGKSLLLRFKVRVADAPGKDEAKAQPWVRVDRPGEVVGWFDNCGDRPVKAGKDGAYQTVTLAGKVDDDALSINVGVMVFGTAGATAWLQSVAFEEGELKSADVPPSPLSERGLANLRAFARLYGQVKYFHPSDEAFGADWVTIACEGAQRVEKCADAVELAKALQEVFAGVGVGLQVWAGDDAPMKPEAPAAWTRVTGWQHNGLSFGPEFPAAGNSIYKSTRIRETPTEEKPGKLPKPGTCAEGSEGGVRWRVPVVLAVDGGATTPKAPGGSPAVTREGFRPTGNDRVTRLAGVVIAWNVFEHFYPYFDAVKTDWSATLTRSLKDAANDADERAFIGTLRRLVADLHDGHGGVYKNELSPPKGMPCGWRFIGDELIVTSDGGGLKAGDRVTAVDGQKVADLYAKWLAWTSAPTEQWGQHVVARNLRMYAPAGDPSVVDVDRADAATTVRVPLTPVSKMANNDPPRPENGAVVGRVERAEKAEILYFNLHGGKTEAFEKEVERLSGAAGIVFDLRGYPDSAATVVLRHLTEEPLQSAKWIIPSITMPGGQGGGGWTWLDRSRWHLPPLQPRLGGKTQPVVFVTDGRAVSYAESVMGIVEAYKLGEIVGGATAGTNGNVNPFTLPGGYGVSWTGMRVLKHDGSRHHGVGIAPTVPCEPTREGIAAGRDELIEKAVEVIKSKLAR